MLDVQARLERERTAFEDSILTRSTDTAAAQTERGRAAAADRHAQGLQSGDVRRSSATNSGDTWCKGRDANPRPRHHERASWLQVTRKFNNLPRGARCNLAQLIPADLPQAIVAAASKSPTPNG